MKKWISMAICLIMVLTVLAVPALAAGAELEYRLELTDGSGREVTDVSALNAGETVNVAIKLNRTDKDEPYDVYGIEVTLLSSGLTYNGDGSAFDGAMSVTSAHQAVAGTDTVSFRYMDIKRQGMSVSDKLTVGTCSYTVAQTGASLRISTKLVYETACGHENTTTKYENNKDGTHDIKTVCVSCGEVLNTDTEKCTYTETVTKEPGCETEGEKTFTCSKCGHSYKESIKAEGHKWDEGKVTKEATETEEGEKTFTCTVCGEKKTEKIPVKTPTKPDDGKDQTKPDDGKKPDDEKKPDDTKKPDNTKPDSSKSDPGTGDNGFIVVYAVMAAIAVAGAGLIIILKKKHA